MLVPNVVFFRAIWSKDNEYKRFIQSVMKRVFAVVDIIFVSYR